MPVAPPIAGFQPLIVPSNVAKIKTDGADTPFSVIVKSVGWVLIFPTIPVDVPRVPAGWPGAGGTVTNSGICVPVPVYRVENPVPLSLVHQGLVGSATRPQALTRCGSV